MNKNFFRAWTPEMAYVLGFIAADGWISGNRTLGIELNDSDLDHLKKICALIEHDSTTIEPCPERDSVRLCIYSVDIVKDLNNLGIFSNKSLNLKWNNPPKEVLFHFTRGYLDGDGCICRFFHTPSLQDEISISFSGTFNFLTGLQIALELDGSISLDSPCCLSYGGRYQTLKLGKLLYLDSTNSTRMERKFKIFNKFEKEFEHILNEKRKGGFNYNWFAPTAKLNSTIAEEIRARKGIETANILAAKFNVSPSTIYRIWSNQIWPSNLTKQSQDNRFLRQLTCE